ncbi:MAG: hypothetical protein WB562_15485, partial [Candidatus Sulfotelmatobacter sp.]
MGTNPTIEGKTADSVPPSSPLHEFRNSLKEREGRGTQCLGDVSETQSLGHPSYQDPSSGV